MLLAGLVEENLYVDSVCVSGHHCDGGAGLGCSSSKPTAPTPVASKTSQSTPSTSQPPSSTPEEANPAETAPGSAPLEGSACGDVSGANLDLATAMNKDDARKAADTLAKYDPPAAVKDAIEHFVQTGGAQFDDPDYAKDNKLVDGWVRQICPASLHDSGALPDEECEAGSAGCSTDCRFNAAGCRAMRPSHRKVHT
jgi:hypothetical protein